MGQVVVEVNGRPYTMNCSDGEEEHLMELAQLLDTEVTSIKRGVGQVGDIRLLLMAGLVVADRLSDALRRIEELQEQIEGMRDARNGMKKQGAEQEELMAERIEAAAKRLEALARERAEANEAGGDS
jgi:cell division protein ZapA